MACVLSFFFKFSTITRLEFLARFKFCIVSGLLLIAEFAGAVFAYACKDQLDQYIRKLLSDVVSGLIITLFYLRRYHFELFTLLIVWWILLIYSVNFIKNILNFRSKATGTTRTCRFWSTRCKRRGIVAELTTPTTGTRTAILARKARRCDILIIYFFCQNSRIV